MENDEHEELEKNGSHIQESECAGTSIEAEERRTETLAQPIYPLATKLMLMLLVKGHRRSENNMKLIKILNIWRMHFRGFLHYTVKISSQRWNKCKNLKYSGYKLLLKLPRSFLNRKRGFSR